MAVSLMIVLLGILLDQLSKHWTSTVLKPVGTIPLIDGVFHLTYAENTGAAFSLLTNGRWFFVAVTVVILAGLIVVLKKGYIRSRVGIFATLLIISGAIGNLIDRIRLGYVVDMLDFRLIRFAIFNVADSLLTVGEILLIYYLLFMHDRILKKERENADDDHHISG